MLERIRYLIMLKTNILYGYADKCMKIKINTDDDLLLEKSIKQRT